MRKRAYTIWGLALLFTAAVLLAETFLQPRVLLTSLHPSVAEADKTRLRLVKEVYDLNIIIPRERATYAATYIPRYQMTEQADADRIAARFGMAGIPKETEEAYVYTSAGKSLTVWLHINKLVYEAHTQPTVPQGEALALEGAAPRAVEIVESLGLNAAHARAVAEQTDGGFTIQLITKLGGADNLAFPTTVILDGSGGLLALEAYTFAYDRLASCRIVSLKAACAGLPLDFAPGTRIDIKRASLVYRFTDSILCPAYLFEGEFAGGGVFYQYVDAAVYAGN